MSTGVDSIITFQAVRLERTSLSERLLTQITFVRSNTCMSSGMSLQIEGIVEALSAEGAQVSFDVRVTFHVTVEETLQIEAFTANVTSELVVAFDLFDRRWCALLARHRLLFAQTTRNVLDRERILDAMSTIDEFQLNLWRKSQLGKEEESKRKM